MERIFTFIALVAISITATAQKDHAVFKVYDKGESYYYNTILKDINSVLAKQKTEKPYKRLKLDTKGKTYPNKVSMYKNQVWHNKPISQGNTGTCWCFSTTSFYESEVYRLTKQKVKLSEMFTVYWEYVQKAKGFVESRGTTEFSEGSEGNAVTRMYKMHGVVRESDYNGLLPGQKFYTHEEMYNEMHKYLLSVKKSDAWNEDQVISTIKSILNHYMGVPPTEITVNGKKMTPKQYLTDVLKINPDDYVEILSYKQEPYWKKCSYDVPDNWWHSKDYYNVPLDVFMQAITNAIKNGYSSSIGGDVSEPGLVAAKGDPQVAVIPDFDIPTKYINDDARQFRFSNKTTTDDHGMHLVGYLEKDGETWFLIKDSSSGSRNNDPKAPEFGYYFFRSDYVKLKMMGFTVHKDAVKDILKKFK